MTLSFLEVGRGGGDMPRDDYIFEGRQFYDGIIRSEVAVIFRFHTSFTKSLYLSSHLLGAWVTILFCIALPSTHTQGVNSFGGFFVLFSFFKEPTVSGISSPRILIQEG